MLPANFQTAIEKIRALERHDRYLGAFVFGSAARDEVTADSDLDVNVIVDEAKCDYINHPFLEGIKLDITFLSHDELAERMRRQGTNGRIPMLAESLVLFDKTGALTALKKETQQIVLPRPSENDARLQQFMLYHADNKAKRNVEADPDSALLSMGIDINDVLKIHYKSHGRWWVSNKRVLADLDSWDAQLAELLRQFVRSADAKRKYLLYREIFDHVASSVGGQLAIEDNVCDCASCTTDLLLLTQKEDF